MVCKTISSFLIDRVTVVCSGSDVVSCPVIRSLQHTYGTSAYTVQHTLRKVTRAIRTTELIFMMDKETKKNGKL